MRPFFDSKGQEALRGAPENRRNVRSMQKKYCTRVLAEGVNMEHRSKPQGYSGEESGNKEWTMLLAGKQLAMAIYMAAKKEPDNHHVRKVLQAGYPVLMRSSKMPSDMKKIIVKRDNMFHDGQSTSLAELFDAVDEVEAAWGDEKDRRGSSYRYPFLGYQISP